ncbi:MAG: hypothetical protein EOM78_17860, partial [Erysipelotrichia bacterium]|nr:hypothetical protein [Erysipelotrichia bacterium]
PYALMFKDLKTVNKYTNSTLKEQEILSSKEKPIVLVKKKENTSLSSKIAPNVNHIGCFIAYTPLHHLLFRYLDAPIIATSANLKDEPIIKDLDEVFSKLGHIVDFVLDFNRDIVNACDDSVIQIVKNHNIKLRNARGYAPTSIKLEKEVKKKILAMGANQKATISLAFKNNLILSPHIGDLNSLESLEYFERTINTFKNFYDFEPEIIVCDKHPNYESTKFALKLKNSNPNIELIQVQHHYAHILSVMAEHKIDKEVLGIAFDGTGYGDDGNIWGGEVFIADRKTYKRLMHIKYFRLLGGEMAVKEPKRVALSLLFDNFTLEEILDMNNPCVKAFKRNEIRMLYTMWQKALNAPYTSSVGRLFDAIASFADILQTQSYEGETGLQIEKYYDFLDFEVSPTLMGDDESIFLIDDILNNYEWEYLSPLSNKSLYFNELKSLVSLLKRERISAKEFLSFTEAEIEDLKNDPENISSRGSTKGEIKKSVEKRIESLEKTKEFVRFYETYEEEKKKLSMMDYDDVLEYAVYLVENFEDVKNEIRENYLYVLVDEHQDSSGVQNSFLKAVWKDTENPNIFVVG